MPSIGRYEIQKEIGRGAMGVVYLAHDPHLQRQVAVKTYTLPDGISAALAVEFHQRFLREARAAASLSHPGIVTVFDAGEDPVLKVPFIAMEYVPGQSLKQRLDQGDLLDPSWVARCGGILADALHVAHQAGIVHRDIKPANILIRDGDGAPKLADFGVARLTTSDLTRSGSAVGSPGYMSPEQIRGGALDGRSDLFSLAVVLYEALCGRRPFHGDDMVSLAYSIIHDTQIPLSRQLRDCPAGLDEFFDRALSKDPDKRFSDGTTFREAFVAAGSLPALVAVDSTVMDVIVEASQASMPVPLPAAVPGKTRRSVAVPLALAALLCIGVAGAGYARFRGAGAPQRIAPAQAPAPHPARTPEKPPAPRVAPLTVPAGTGLRLTLHDAVSSSSSRAGETITARLAQPVMVGERVAIPAGSTLHGRVTEATPATRGLSDKGGSMTLSFDRIVTPTGQAIPISASLTSVAPKSTKKTAGVIGGSAAGGAILGKVLGGKTKDAAVGAVAGAAVGTGIAAGTKGKDVGFPAGSSLSIKLDDPLTIGR
ncbi:MAG: protein kinase domain-containing protein [Candidatus Polarisedimenticolia bacterium]